MLVRRHQTIFQAVENAPFLPFLYQTRTIARPYATQSEGRIEHASDEACTPSRTPHPGPGRPSRRPTANAPFREFVDHVPFEGAMRPQDARADFEGSTITPSERRAFEKLFQLHVGQRKDDQSQYEKTRNVDPTDGMPSRSNLQKLDDIMDAAGAEPEFDGDGADFPKPLQLMAKEAHDQRKKSSRPSPTDAIRTAAEKDLEKVSSYVGNATTDVEIWDILQKRVFKRVIALNLDDTKKSKRSTKQQNTGETTISSKNRPAPFTDLDVLTLTLPHHLSRAHRQLTTRFPRSALPLALLPHLRRLGPAAAALGTSTQLYNQHMRALFRQNGDLDGVVDTLREMDEQVYEYNEFTEALVARVLAHARQARAGTWGEAVKVFWESEGMRARVRRVVKWGKIVRERREEQALRRARAEEQRVEEGAAG